MMKKLKFSTLFVFLLGLLVPLAFYDRPSLYIAPKHLVAAGLVTIWLVMQLFKLATHDRKRSLLIFPIDWVIIAFGAWALLSLLWSINPWLGFEYGLLLSLAFSVYILVRELPEGEDPLPAFLYASVISSLPICFYGLLQFSGWDFLTKTYAYENLMVSTFGNKNFLAEYLIFVIWAHFMLWACPQSKRIKGFLLLSLVLNLFTLMATISKTAYLSLILMLFLTGTALLFIYRQSFAHFRKRILIYGSILFLGLVGFYIGARLIPWRVNPDRYFVSFGRNLEQDSAYFDTRQNLQAAFHNQAKLVFLRLSELSPAYWQSGQNENLLIRYYIWKNTWPIIRNHWVWGVGLRNWQIEYFRHRGLQEKMMADKLSGPGAIAFDAHNEVLQFWAELGTIGLILGIWIWAGLVWLGILQARKEQSKSRILRLAFGVIYLVILFLQSLFGFTLHNIWPLLTFAIIAAWMVRQTQSHRSWRLAAWPLLGVLLIWLGLSVFYQYQFLRRDYFNTLAQLFKNAGNLKSAEIGYRNALHYAPWDYQTHFWLAGVLIDKAAQLNTQREIDQARFYTADAVEHWQQALKYHPNLERAYYNIANVSLENGDFKKALSYFQKAIAIFPCYTMAYTNIGNIYALSALQLPADEAHYPIRSELFQKALDHHLQAYEYYQQEFNYTRDPGLLKNLGIDFYYLQQPVKSNQFFQLYLNTVNDPPDKTEIENTIMENTLKIEAMVIP